MHVIKARVKLPSYASVISLAWTNETLMALPVASFTV